MALAVGVFRLAGSGLHCGAFPAPLSGRFWHRGSWVSGLLSESSFFPRWSSPPSDATALGTGSPGLQGAFLFVSLGFDGIQKMPLLECDSCSPSLTLTHVVRWGWGGSCRWGGPFSSCWPRTASLPAAPSRSWLWALLEFAFLSVPVLMLCCLVLCTLPSFRVRSRRLPGP